MVSRALATASATALWQSVTVTLAGADRAVKHQTVLESPTVMVGVSAITRWLNPLAKTALLAGWVRVVTSLAYMAYKIPWIVASASAIQVGQDAAAILNAVITVSSIKHWAFASAITHWVSGASCVTFLAVQAMDLA